ncbi:hypothetical protein G8V07_14340 [Clostridium botulinum D/C]|uniref:hypothetical protein n=1 Tax=Clostridium botulinum TaxID=1491 RepID=UPI001E541843|nr:hypothetical protein [Clostridium botulinum]MCD3321631.1 hypothetical protein [Clostridium botulinum D/C]MCD3324904.1 hypothetical protein [Clostridium botulinum D/C]MCD3328157.1 hypothetical protein [Clostridium botulinum D/C]
MNTNNDIKQKIRGNSFKDHKANLLDCGKIKILEWQNPNTKCDYVKYIFDDNKIYVSDDLGEAVYKLTYTDINSFNEINIGDFHEKLTAFSDNKYCFDSDQAVERLKEWKEYLLEERKFEDDFEKQEFMDNIEGLIDGADNCSDKDEWAFNYVNGMYQDFIAHTDGSYFLWIYDIGTSIPYRIHKHLIGLQMASEQLKDSENK